jgi:hypothetical protein
MITKDLKDWSMDDLITAATWKVMEEVIKGQLRDGVYHAVMLALRWKAEQSTREESK